MLLHMWSNFLKIVRVFQNDVFNYFLILHSHLWPISVNLLFYTLQPPQNTLSAYLVRQKHRILHQLPSSLSQTSTKPRSSIRHPTPSNPQTHDHLLLALSHSLPQTRFPKKIVTSNIDSFTNFHRLFHQLSSILDHQTPHLWYDQPFQHRFIDPRSLAFSSIYP